MKIETVLKKTAGEHEKNCSLLLIFWTDYIIYYILSLSNFTIINQTACFICALKPKEEKISKNRKHEKKSKWLTFDLGFIFVWNLTILLNYNTNQLAVSTVLKNFG